MTKWIGATALAAIILFGALAPIEAAEAAHANSVTARKHVRQPAYAYRGAYPAYYGRPVVYAPAPFVAIPPLFGYVWEWW